MNADFVEYSESVGKILANFQALEFSLRLFLYKIEGVGEVTTPLQELPVGAVVPENALTDWSSLGVLIGRYNEVVASPHRVDASVVELRDALAHGRMYLPNMEAAPVLLKFEKPAGGQTRVTFSQQSSAEWLNDSIRRVHCEIEKVQAVLGDGVARPPNELHLTGSGGKLGTARR